MESEKITEPVPAATNESAHNEEGEPSNSNIQSAQDDQHLRSLLTGLLKDQLVDILVLLSMKIPQVAEGLRAAARPTASHRKLIVHGLSEETSLETLTEAFSNSYGEVEDANLTVDRTTGKSRGFGFVTFKSLESVKKALVKQKTWVDGRLARQHPPSEAEIDSTDLDQRKLFVSRITSDVTNEMFYRFFEKYGEIEEGSLYYNRATRTLRGLGFVTFKTVEAAQAAISDPDKNLGGNRISVEIKRLTRQQNEVQDAESVASNAPQIRNRNPYAIINRPSQHYGTSRGLGFVQSRDVRHPQLISGYPPPVAYQPPTQPYQPYFVGGNEPAYGIPVAYQPPIETYQPYYISGYETYGIPVAYQDPTVAYPPPTGAYDQPYFIGYEPAYGIPPAAYQLPPSSSVVYQRPPRGGFMAYPNYFAYQ